MCCFTWATARSQQLLFVALAAGLWCFTASCHAISSSSLPPTPSQTEVGSTMGESIRQSSFHNPTLSANEHLVQICRSSLSAAVQTVQRRTSPFIGIERSLSRAVVIKTKSLPVSATTFPTALSLHIAHNGRKHKHNPTLYANKHAVQICRSSLSAAADGLADSSGERLTSPVNGIERLLSRAIVPKTKSLPVSATTFPTALSLYIAQGRLRKDIRYPSCSQRQNRCHSKRKWTSTWSIVLAWSMPTKYCWVILGRLTSERKASTSPSSFINHSTLLLERSSTKFLV